MTEPENTEIATEIAEPAKEKLITPRGVGRWIAGNSVKFVVAGAVVKLAPEAESGRDKIRLIVGTYVISEMAAAKAKDFMDTRFDEWKQNIDEIKSEMKKLQEKSESNDTTI